MKKLFLSIFIAGFLLSGNAYAKISSSNLNTWYNTCSNAGHGHEFCKCNVETMDEKLSNYEFEKLVSQSWKIGDWMKENVMPVCGYPNN